MKAAQKRRLLTKNKDGQYINNENYEVLRHRSIIEESVIDESQQSYKETGVIWVVDDGETLKWLEAKQPKKESNKEPIVLEYDGLKITEENVDQFIEDNEINIGRAKSAEAKLNKVKQFINKQ